MAMKKYKFEVVIKEGHDEFWESIQGQTGCDIVLQSMEDLFSSEGWEPEIRLVEYTDV